MTNPISLSPKFNLEPVGITSYISKNNTIETGNTLLFQIAKGKKTIYEVHEYPVLLMFARLDLNPNTKPVGALQRLDEIFTYIQEHETVNSSQWEIDPATHTTLEKLAEWTVRYLAEPLDYWHKNSFSQLFSTAPLVVLDAFNKHIHRSGAVHKVITGEHQHECNEVALLVARTAHFGANKHLVREAIQGNIPSSFSENPQIVKAYNLIEQQGLPEDLPSEWARVLLTLSAEDLNPVI